MSPSRFSAVLAKQAVAAVAMAALAGCVTSYETIDLVDRPSKKSLVLPPSVTIPFGADGGRDSEFTRFYQRVFERMQEAAAERDLETLANLLGSYDRPDLPPSIRDGLAGYRAVLGGLRFAADAAAVAQLELLPATDGAAPIAVLGPALRYELRLPALAEPYGLGGGDAEDRFGVSIAYVATDTFVDGGTKVTKERMLEYLPAPLELRGAAVLRIPFVIDVPARDAVHRVVKVRVETVPCNVRSETGPVPIGRGMLARAELELWPQGHEAVRAEPLQHLRAALQNFEPRNFARAYLAAVFAPSSARAEVVGLLVEQVRLGQSDQAQVAMAALRAITDADVAIGDRDGWLAWWQARR